MDQSLENALQQVVVTVSLVVAGLAAATLLLGIAVEWLRRGGPAHPLVRFADRWLPAPSRRFAAAVVAMVTLALPGTAGAAGPAGGPSTGVHFVSTAGGPAPDSGPRSLRDWLTSTGPGVAPPTSTSSTTTTTTTTPRPAPGPTSPRTQQATPSATPAAPDPAPESPPVATVTVAPGDCLWSIAARRLGPTAANAEIDRAWRAVWAANRDAIGADPNLIHPGLVLVVGPTVH